MDLISIIIPVYKVEKYIYRCVDSVVNQTYTNLEIILVDDGSPDNCGKICDEYAQKDNRIKVIHKENGGLSDARNVGIDTSTGDWLFFLDSDDWIHPQTIEVLYKAAIENDVSVSVSGYAQTVGESPEVDGLVKSEICTPKDLYMNHHIASIIACAKLYRKDCFASIRYPIGKLHEDEFVTYRILFAQDRIAFIDQPYYAYFYNTEGIMRGQWNPRRLVMFQAREEQLALFKQMNDKELLDYAEQVYCWLLVSEHKKAVASGFLKENRWLRCKTFLLVIKSPAKFLTKQNGWIVEAFFPRFMHCYWLVRAAIDKIFRKQ